MTLKKLCHTHTHTHAHAHNQVLTLTYLRSHGRVTVTVSGKINPVDCEVVGVRPANRVPVRVMFVSVSLAARKWPVQRIGFQSE